MNLEFAKIFPEDLSRFDSPQFVRFAAALILCLMVVRSCIHLFTADGGAQRIATIDTSVEGGNNIIAIFHQWGATQLVSAGCFVCPLSRIHAIDSAHDGVGATDAICC
jgi:hypothetical protein